MHFVSGFLPYSLDPLGFRSLAARNLLGSAGAGAGGFQVRFLPFLHRWHAHENFKMGIVKFETFPLPSFF